MTELRRHAVTASGWAHIPLIAVGSAVTVATVTAIAVTIRMAQLVIRPVSVRTEKILVVRVNRRARTVTLREHPDAIAPGHYSLYFSRDNGHAKIGDIVSFGHRTVTRRIVSEERGRLRAGIMARVSAWYFDSPDELGVAYVNVELDTEFGVAPAWLVSAQSSDRWVIQVHGRGADRREPLRAVTVFHQEDFNSLIISYRNDGVAPNSLDRRYALGDTEWGDVEAGIRFACEHGAAEIVLMGWSMGGAIVLQTVTRSTLARYVSGIVLDSPVIDWIRVLEYQAGSLRLPKAISSVALRMIGSSWGRWFTGQSAAIDLRRLDLVDRAAELTVPILLMHSDSDTFVPSSGSRALAMARPDIVTFEAFAGAGHTRLWNYDRVRWNAAIAEWLRTFRR